MLHHGDIYRKRRGRPLADYQKKLVIRESKDLPFDSVLIPQLVSDLNKTHITLLSYSNVLNGIKQVQIKGHVWARTIMTHYNGSSFTNYLIKSSITKPDNECFFPLTGSPPARIRGAKLPDKSNYEHRETP